MEKRELKGMLAGMFRWCGCGLIAYHDYDFSFDEKKIDFSVLTGSSRILLLEKVRETMAGRAFLFDLWPIMASELRSQENQPAELPLIHRIITVDEECDSILENEPVVLLGYEFEKRHAAIEHLMQWGGMPGLLPLSDVERHD